VKTAKYQLDVQNNARRKEIPKLISTERFLKLNSLLKQEYKNGKSSTVTSFTFLWIKSAKIDNVSLLRPTLAITLPDN
jgi:hypothetical protein